MGAFGDFDIADVEVAIPRGKYPLEVDLITGPHENTSEENDGPKEQRFYTVTLKVSFDNEEFGGTRLEKLYFNVYPEITKKIFESYSEEDKARFRSNVRYFKLFNYACGVTDDDMQIKEYDFEDLVGSKLYGDCFSDKNGSPRVLMRTLAPRLEGKDNDAVTADDLDIFN